MFSMTKIDPSRINHRIAGRLCTTCSDEADERQKFLKERFFHNVK
jgi:hypothetical protein